jgi:hypothetical protein
MKCFLTLLMASFISQAVPAVEVRGGPSCGSWVQERQVRDWPSVANELWLVGFLSGLAVGSNHEILAGKDNPSLFLWVDNYCRANPLKEVADAGFALATELVKNRIR